VGGVGFKKESNVPQNRWMMERRLGGAGSRSVGRPAGQRSGNRSKKRHTDDPTPTWFYVLENRQLRQQCPPPRAPRPRKCSKIASPCSKRNTDRNQHKQAKSHQSSIQPPTIRHTQNYWGYSTCCPQKHVRNKRKAKGRHEVAFTPAIGDWKMLAGR
jgi:hypothetical protein